MSLHVVDGTGDSTIEAFLDFLYGTVEGFVYLPTKLRTPEPGTDPWHQRFFNWPAQKQEAVEHILTMTSTEEVYISPSLFSAESSLKEHLLGSWVVWIEFDGKVPEELQEVPEPSLKIQSSEEGHEHWYWKLSEFANNVTWIEEVNRSISYKLGADTSGWDANQVLRPPNTLNHKRNRQVRVLSANKWTFDTRRFDVVERPPKATQLYVEADLLDVSHIYGKYAWPDEMQKLFKDRNVQEGERSSKLMQLGYFCVEQGFTDQEAYSVLYTADKWWGKFHDRRDRDQRLNDIIVRARLKHPDAAAQLPEFRLPIMGALELLNSKVELKWAVTNFLEDNGCLLLSAKPGIGKTRLSLQGAISLALGIPFMQYEVPTAKRVGFFSLEMHQPGIQYFLKHMLTDFPVEVVEQLQERLKIIPLGESFNVLDIVNTSRVQAFIEEHGIDILFFDSLGRVTNKSLNNDEDTKALFDWDAAIRKRYGIATWYVHHNRKATAQNKQPKTLDDVFGSVYVTAGPTDIYALWSKEVVNSDIKLINLKHRYSEQEREYGVTTNPVTLMFKKGSTFAARASSTGILEVEASHDGLITSSEITDDSSEPPSKPNLGFSV